MKNKEVSDFEVYKEMAEKEMDIRCAIDLVSIKTVKRGGLITFGVPRETLNEIIANGGGNYYLMFYVVNKRQFDEVQKEKDEIAGLVKGTNSY